MNVIMQRIELLKKKSRWMILVDKIGKYWDEA